MQLIADVQTFLGVVAAGSFRVTQKKGTSRVDLRKVHGFWSSPSAGGPAEQNPEMYSDFLSALCVHEKLMAPVGGQWTVCRERAGQWLMDPNPLHAALRFWKTSHIIDEHATDPFQSRRLWGQLFTTEKRTALIEWISDRPAGEAFTIEQVMQDLSPGRVFRLEPRVLYGKGADGHALRSNEEAVTWMLQGPLRWMGLVGSDGARFHSTSIFKTVVQGEPLPDLPPWEHDFVVQPNLEVLAPAHLHPQIYLRLASLSTLVKADRYHRFSLTRDSLLGALDAGQAAEEVLAFLQEHSSVGVPDTVKQLFIDVTRRYGEIELGSGGAYVRVKEASMMQELERLAVLDGQFVRTLSDTVKLLRPTADRERILRELRNLGYSARVEGETPRTPMAGRIQLPLTEDEAKVLGLSIHLALIVLNQTANPAHKGKVEMLDSLLLALGAGGTFTRFSAIEVLDGWLEVVHARRAKRGRPSAAGE